jgi:hypothetical protein
LGTATQDPEIGDLVRDQRWFPEEFHAPRQLLTFVHAERGELARQPFLDHRWKQDSLPRRQAALEAVAAELSAGPAPRLDFIWHTSFCCSTLLARALDHPGKCLALSEPLVLVSIADAKRTGSLDQGWQVSRLPEIVFRLLARPEAPGGRVLVKPSNFANLLLPDAARLTSGKALLLYSDLPSFLLSVLKSGLPLRKYVRRLFSNLVGQVRDQLPWTQAEIFQMSDVEIAALVWHMQIVEFRSAVRLLGPARAASLDCDAFLANPAEVLRQLDAFFGLGLGESHIAETVAGPLLREHAKAPGVPFDAKLRAEQMADARRQFGSDIERVVEWSYRVSPLTPRGVPLPNPLVATGKTYDSGSSL